MDSILLIHWNAAEAETRLEVLKRAGYAARVLAPQSSVSLKALEADLPAAIVIDLSRLPSQGCAVGIALRQRKSTRAIPIVFVDGNAEKTARTQEILPDAGYATWARIAPVLKKALSAQPVQPVVPDTMAGYSGTPLPKKLGIKAGASVLLLNGPDAFEEQLTPLPEGVTFKRSARGPVQLVLLFAESRADLARQFETAEACIRDKGHMWIIWPKKSSGVSTDVTETFVRVYGLERNWVDFKICAVDSKWSGLCFARR